MEYSDKKKESQKLKKEKMAKKIIACRKEEVSRGEKSTCVKWKKYGTIFRSKSKPKNHILNWYLKISIEYSAIFLLEEAL